MRLWRRCSLKSIPSDYVIDLHTGGKAIYYGYTFEGCLSSTPYWGLPYIIKLADEFEGAFDEAFLLLWIKLQKAFKKAGRDIPFHEFDKEAFTPELGSADMLDRNAMKTNAERIVNYLRYKGVLEGEAQPAQGPFYKCQHKHYAHYYAPGGGFLLWNKKPGDMLAAGDVLATILRPYNEQAEGKDETEVPIIATDAGLLNDCTITQTVHEGLEIANVMTKLEEM